MARYAEGTSVPVDRTRGEIERTLRRYGADQFVSGWDAEKAVMAFRTDKRHVRFELPLPDRDADEFRLTPSRKWERGEKQQEEAYEAEVQRRWRALGLIVKAKLEAINSGIATFDDEFLAYVVLPSGATIGQFMAEEGRLDKAISAGQVRSLLPSGKD